MKFKNDQELKWKIKKDIEFICLQE
jgi:hypothetical protein